jgi:hypothetical protein
MEDQVEALERLSRPGKQHAKLQSLAGEFRMESARVEPDGSETKTALTGLARLEWILGSRYLRWDSTAVIDGREFTTHGWVGYDNRIEEYQLSMITSVSSGMAIWHGGGNPLSEGITFVMEQFDQKSGARLRARNRLRILSQELFVTEDLDSEDRPLQRTYYRRVTK